MHFFKLEPCYDAPIETSSKPRSTLVNMMKEQTQEEYLENILHSAETLTSAPPLKQAIPKQWLPGWLRLPLKLSYLPVLMLDLVMQKAARGIIRPPFKQVGTCKRRGNCCYYILLPEAKGPFGKIFYFWQTQVNGFFIREKSPPDNDGEHMLIMGCRHLKNDGSCGSYRTRPAVCRRWPIIEHFGRPRVLKGCGYDATLRKSYQKEPYITLLGSKKDQS